MAGDKNHGRIEAREHLVDGCDARAAVGQLNIGQNEFGLAFLSERRGFLMRSCYTNDRMPKARKQIFQVRCCKGLVFNNKDLGGRKLIGDFVVSAGNVGRHFGDVRFKNFRYLLGFDP